MKIIQINSVYGSGSTGKIVQSLHLSLLEKGYESFVLYGRGKPSKEKNVLKVSSEIEAKMHGVFSRLFGVDFGYSFFATKKIIRIIQKIQPDIVHLQCLNGHFVNVYRLLDYLKKHNIKTMLTLHAEIMHTAGCEHAISCDKWREKCYKCDLIRGSISHFFRDDASLCYSKMKEAFEDFDDLSIISVSPWLMNRAKLSPILINKYHNYILNGLDTSIFRYKVVETDPSVKKILFVTPFFENDKSHLKGGYYVIKAAERMPSVVFYVVGTYKKTVGLPNNIKMIGRLNDQQDLARLYSMSDLTMIASKRETFSMVVAESLCCGTPVVGFKAGGPEMIAIQKYASFVDYGDLDSLVGTIDLCLTKKFDKSLISREAREKFAELKMTENYVKEYNELLKR